jgi:hypothetical protein
LVQAADDAVQTQALLVGRVGRAEACKSIPMGMDLEYEVILGLVTHRQRRHHLTRNDKPVGFAIVVYAGEHLAAGGVRQLEAAQNSIPD